MASSPLLLHHQLLQRWCCCWAGRRGAAVSLVGGNRRWALQGLLPHRHASTSTHTHKALKVTPSLAHPAPKFVPFRLTPERARENMRQWLAPLAPRAVKDAVLAQDAQRAFLPFYVYSADVHSRFRGEVLKGASNVSFDALKSRYRVEDKHSWADTGGWVDAGDRSYLPDDPAMQVYAGYTYRRENVQAVKGAFATEAVEFDLGSAQHLQEIEESLIAPVEVTPQFAHSLIVSRIHEMEAIVGENVLKQYFAASDVRKMRLQANILNSAYQLVYLPTFIYTYSLGSRTYRAFVSGVSGAIGGQRIHSGVQAGTLAGMTAGALTALVFPEPMTIATVSGVTGGIVGSVLAKLPIFRQDIYDRQQMRELERQMQIRDVAMDLGLTESQVEKEEEGANQALKELRPKKQQVPSSDLNDPQGHYAALGLAHEAQNATLGQIKNAFRGLVVQSLMRSQQDPSATDGFKRLCASYRILRNENQRRKYDEDAVAAKQAQNAAEAATAAAEEENQSEQETLAEAEATAEERRTKSQASN